MSRGRAHEGDAEARWRLALLIGDEREGHVVGALGGVEIGLRDDETNPGPGPDEDPDDSATTAAPTRTPSAETTTTAPATAGADG